MQKVSSIRELNSAVGSTVVNNPYLRLFYLLLIENNPKKAFNEFISSYTINMFDYLALACKFLDSNQLKYFLE